jgi:uncharacterized cupin superfamily protein
MDIKVEKPKEEYLKERNVESWPIWEKEVSRFDWPVETPDGKKVEIGKGDFVTFPKGLDCVWDVKEPIRKHYTFR